MNVDLWRAKVTATKEARAPRVHKPKTLMSLCFSAGAVRNQHRSQHSVLRFPKKASSMNSFLYPSYKGSGSKHGMVSYPTLGRSGLKLFVLLLIACTLSLQGPPKAMAADLADNKSADQSDQPKESPPPPSFHTDSSHTTYLASPAPAPIHQISYAAAPVLTGAFLMPLHPSRLSGPMGWLSRMMARIPAGFQKWSAGLVAALSGAYFVNVAAREPFSQTMSLEDLWSGVLLSASQLQEYPPDGERSYQRFSQNQQDPTPEDPGPMMPPPLMEMDEWDVEALSDKAFDRYDQKYAHAGELRVMKQILSRFVNSHLFLNSPGAEKLMLLPSTLSEEHLRERLSLLTDAKGKPLLTPKALASWDRRQLYNFLASGIQSALEAHIFLGAVLANEWKTVELSSLYEEEPGTILTVKYRLFKRLAQYDKVHHKARVKLGKNASMAEVHKALIGLSPSYIKSTLEKKMIALNMPPLTVGQAPLLQGKHLYSYYLYLSDTKDLKKKDLKKGNKTILLQEIFEVQESEFLEEHPEDIHVVSYSDRIKYPTQEAFRKKVINTYTHMIEFFIHQDVFVPPELIAYNGSFGEPAEEILGALHSTLLTYNAQKFDQIGQKLGLKVPLTRDKVEMFLEIISPFSLAQVLLLSQVLGVDTVDKKELYAAFDLSLSEIKNYSERMKAVFVNFLSPAGSHKTLAAQLATRKLKTKATTQLRILSESQLAEKFSQFTDRKLVRILLNSVETTYTIKAGVDLSVDRLAFHEMIKTITADPVKQRIFFSRYLHMDEADLAIIGEIFQLPEETLIQKNLEIRNEIFVFFKKHAESRDGGFQVWIPNHTVTVPLRKRDRDKENYGERDQTFAKDQMSYESIHHQIFYQRFSQYATQPYSEELADTMLDMLHPQNNPDWDSYQEQLGTRHWVMNAVGQSVLISKEQYETFVTDVLDTPLKKHLFLSNLVELPKLSMDRLSAIHDKGIVTLEKVDLVIKMNFLQVIKGAELVDVSWGRKSGGGRTSLRQQFKLYTDSFAFNLLSAEDLVGNMEKAMGQRYSKEPRIVTGMADLIKQKQQDWVSNDKERAIYLYLFHGFQPGQITAADSYAGRDSIPHGERVMKLWSLTQPKVSSYIDNVKHLVAQTFEDLSLAASTEVESTAVVSTDVRPFIEWYEDRKLREITERLADWYGDVTKHRQQVDMRGALSSLQSFIHSELVTPEDWYNYLVGILGYPVVGDLLEAQDAAGISSYGMSRDRADRLRDLESKLLEFIGASDREVFRPSTSASVSSRSVVLRAPTSLLTFPLHTFEAKLRRMLMKPDYSLSAPKLRFFEQHYLDAHPMLWQIYLQFAGYQTEFAGSIHLHELHPAVLATLQRKMLVALSLATDSSSRLYVNDMISVFSALKAPSQVSGATLDLKELRSLYELYSMEAVMQHLKVLPWLPSSKNISKPYLAYQSQAITPEEAALHKDLAQYLASEVFVDPFLLHVFLSHIMALDEFSVSKMSTTYGYSKREITEAIRQIIDQITAIIEEHIDRNYELPTVLWSSWVERG